MFRRHLKSKRMHKIGKKKNLWCSTLALVLFLMSTVCIPNTVLSAQCSVLTSHVQYTNAVGTFRLRVSNTLSFISIYIYVFLGYVTLLRCALLSSLTLFSIFSVLLFFKSTHYFYWALKFVYHIYSLTKIYSLYHASLCLIHLHHRHFKLYCKLPIFKLVFIIHTKQQKQVFHCSRSFTSKMWSFTNRLCFYRLELPKSYSLYWFV